MKQIITAKLKLLTTPEQVQALRQTQLTYRDALNAVSHYAFEHGKTTTLSYYTEECMPSYALAIIFPRS